MSQREMMRALVSRFGRDEDRVCREYVRAEQRGEVPRKSDKHGITAEQYARALWRDAVQKGWL